MLQIGNILDFKLRKALSVGSFGFWESPVDVEAPKGCWGLCEYNVDLFYYKFRILKISCGGSDDLDRRSEQELDYNPRL